MKIIRKIIILIKKIFSESYFINDELIFPFHDLTLDNLNNLDEKKLRRFIADNGTKEGYFIDIGANTGLISLTASKYFKKVYSFEPIISHCDMFEKVMKINKCLNYNLFRVGLGSVECTAKMNNNNKDSKICKKGNLLVNIKTLDSYKFKNIRMIKIDVEGYELEVIKGSINTLKSNNLILIFESWTKNINYLEIASILKKLGYSKMFNKEDNEYWTNK